MSIIIPKRKLIKKVLPIVLCAPLILPITAVKGKELGMFMPLMGVSAGSKWVAPPSTTPIWKGFKTKTTSTAANTPINYTSCDIGTADDRRIIVLVQASQDGGGSTESLTVGGTQCLPSPNGWWQNVSGVNLEMYWLPIPTSYGTTTTISFVMDIVQSSHQLGYWIAYPYDANVIAGAASEQSTTTAASATISTEDGGFIMLGGVALAVTGLTFAKNSGTGTLTEHGDDTTAKSISGGMITGCNGGSVVAQVTRDIGGSGWKALGYVSCRRSY